MPDLKRIFSFGAVGALGFAVDAAVLMATIGALGPVGGRVVSVAAAMTTTWACNRHFTFADKRSDMPLAHEFGRYVLSMLGGLAVNWVVYGLAMIVLPKGNAWPVAAVAAGSLAGMVLNLFLADRFVFRSPAR